MQTDDEPRSPRCRAARRNAGGGDPDRRGVIGRPAGARATPHASSSFLSSFDVDAYLGFAIYNSAMIEHDCRVSDVTRRTRQIARRLERDHGRPVWRRHGDPVDELVGTILSQHTSDVNTARAFASLKARFPSWEAAIEAPAAEVAAAIRAGGLANLKAPRIQAVLAGVRARYGSFDLSHLETMTAREARAELVRFKGVGPKTASRVLLFSLGLPAMPVDTHVYRVTRRLGLIGAAETAERAHETLEAQLGENRDDVYAFHLNLIAHGRRVCHARRPARERCTLAECCDDYHTRQSANHPDQPLGPPDQGSPRGG